jgi:hypothetical protein
VRCSVARLLFREWVGGSGGKHERGGRKPNGRTGRPRRGEGQESIGFFGCLTIPGRERLLNRSKALESGSTPVRVGFAGLKPSLLMPAWASCVTLQGWGRPLVIGLAGSPVGSVTDVGNSPDVARALGRDFRQERVRIREEGKGGGKGPSGATHERSALTQRHESNGRREASRLVEWEKL